MGASTSLRPAPTPTPIVTDASGCRRGPRCVERRTPRRPRADEPRSRRGDLAGAAGRTRRRGVRRRLEVRARARARPLAAPAAARRGGGRLATIGEQSLWYDEAYTPVHVLHASLGATLRTMVHTENTPPLWYML